MKDIFDLVKGNPLFLGIDKQDFDHLLTCLSARLQLFNKDEIMLRTGNPVHYVGILVSGHANIIKEDRDGNQSLLTELSASDIFGEVFACAQVLCSPVSVICTEKSEVLFITYNRVLTSCSSSCSFHTVFIKNMVMLLAKKTLFLHQKNELLSKRTTREKLLLFFDMQRGSAKQFSIPYNREELAQYLCVDRSAMSNELSKMRNEGLLQFYKNTFEIL